MAKKKKKSVRKTTKPVQKRKLVRKSLQVGKTLSKTSKKPPRVAQKQPQAVIQEHSVVQKHVHAKVHSKPQKYSHATREVVPSAAGGAVCREVACELMATTGNYCRLHYIKNWKKIKRKEMILKERKLNHYIEELVSKYPDKYIEAIRQDLASEKDFAKVISDLEIEENLDDFEVETEGAESIINHLKRDYEDDEDLF